MYAKIFYNTAIQAVSKIISTVLALAAVAIVTRELGPEGFGQYTTIITFLSFFAILADFGITLITTQMVSRPGADKEKILNNLFSFRLLSAAIFLGLAPAAVLFFPYSGLIKEGTALAVFSFIFIALNQIFVGLFQKELKMGRVSLAEILSRVVLFLGVVFAAGKGFGLLGILAATVFSSFVNFIVLYFFSRKFFKLKMQFDREIWKQIILKSWPLAVTIALNLIYLKADTLILSLVKTQTEVGIYGAAYKVIDVLITLPFMFAGVVLPIMTLSWAEKNMEAFNKILQRSFDFMVICALPFVIGSQILAHDVMVLVAGKEFYASGSALRILIIACGAIFIGTVFSHAIIAMENQKKIITAYAFTSITSLIGYLIFIPKYSYFGAAWMTVYSEAVIAFASFYFTWKYSKFIPRFGIFYKSLLSSLLMGLILLIMPKFSNNFQINLLIELAIAIISYFIFLYLSKAVTKTEILELAKRNETAETINSDELI